MKLYNTLTKKVDDFKPIKPNEVGIYSCGPTVYDFAHIGHFRTYVGTDILKRILKYNGYKVKQVMNITDVGHLTSDSDTGQDKMEKGAQREGKTVWEIAEFYTTDFFNALEKLNIRKPEIIAKATDNIPEMIELIKKLKKNGLAYKTADGIYFNTSKFRNYGRLSGGKKGIKAGARIQMVTGKKHPTDFALWKFSPKDKKRQMEWPSPWGIGFPGWHIECSAMAMKFLGKTIDIHTGGVDHIPIHHENEIAQSEGTTKQQFVNCWVHFEFLMVDNRKMSKSLGNIYHRNDIEKKGFSLLDCRYLFLTAHYRDKLNFTWKSLNGAKTALSNLKALVSPLLKAPETADLSPEKLNQLNDFRRQFETAIYNDLNLPQALAVLWKLVKSNIPPRDKYDLILEMDQVFGLKLDRPSPNPQLEKMPDEIIELIKQRERLRKEKNWSKSDMIRKEIEKKGYLIKDTSKNTVIEKTNL